MSATLEVLPLEVLCDLAGSYLSGSDISSLSQVSRRLRSVSQQNSVWYQLCARRWGAIVVQHRNTQTGSVNAVAPQSESPSVKKSGEASTTPRALTDWRRYYLRRVSWFPGFRYSPRRFFQETSRKEPWRMLVSCIMFGRTSGGPRVVAVVEEFFVRYPQPMDAVKADPEVLGELLRPLGIYRNRTKRIQRFCHEFFCREDWREPKDLYGIGDFGNDAWRILCRGGDQDWRKMTLVDDVARQYRAWLREDEEIRLKGRGSERSDFFLMATGEREELEELDAGDRKGEGEGQRDDDEEEDAGWEAKRKGKEVMRRMSNEHKDKVEKSKKEDIRGQKKGKGTQGLNKRRDQRNESAQRSERAARRSQKRKQQVDEESQPQQEQPQQHQEEEKEEEEEEMSQDPKEGQASTSSHFFAEGRELQLLRSSSSSLSNVSLSQLVVQGREEEEEEEEKRMEDGQEQDSQSGDREFNEWRARREMIPLESPGAGEQGGTEPQEIEQEKEAETKPRASQRRTQGRGQRGAKRKSPYFG